MLEVQRVLVKVNGEMGAKMGASMGVSMEVMGEEFLLSNKESTECNRI